MFVAVTVAIIAILIVAILYSAVRILREYERGVVFTLGRYTGTKGPGFFLLVPLVQQMVRVDLRVVVDEVPPQDVIFPRQCLGRGECRHLFSRRGRRASDYSGQQLPGGNEPTRADHAALGIGQTRPRHDVS
jgi:SPFH domain / Band 7 family